MILVISSEKDGHATEVLKRIRSKGGRVQLLDLSDFPQKSFLSMEFNNNGSQQQELVNANGSRIDTREYNVVWWRRPQTFQLHDDINTNTDRNFAFTECHAAISGLWLTLDPFWINNPTHDDTASKKVYQLKAARDVGFTIPDTCITNDPERAKAFITKHGQEHVIYKAFSGTEQAWRETRRLKKEEFNLINNVRFAPVIFQEYIPVKADLRITVIGEHIFAGAIYTNETSYKADFRMVMDEARMESFQLPDKVEDLIHSYMKKLGLVYGAIDMRLTPGGEFIFLEINPSGQWLFVEQRTGLPITTTFVDLLLQKDR